MFEIARRVRPSNNMTPSNRKSRIIDIDCVVREDGFTSASEMRRNTGSKQNYYEYLESLYDEKATNDFIERTKRAIEAGARMGDYSCNHIFQPGVNRKLVCNYFTDRGYKASYRGDECGNCWLTIEW